MKLVVFIDVPWLVSPCFFLSLCSKTRRKSQCKFLSGKRETPGFTRIMREIRPASFQILHFLPHQPLEKRSLKCDQRAFCRDLLRPYACSTSGLSSVFVC